MPLFRRYRLNRVNKQISARESQLASLASQVKGYDKELRTTGLNDISGSQRRFIEAEIDKHKQKLEALKRKKLRLQ